MKEVICPTCGKSRLVFPDEVEKPISNYDKIKRMSIEEMAEFSSVFQRCEFCIIKTANGVNFEECRKITCTDAIHKWLQQEAQQ